MKYEFSVYQMEVENHLFWVAESKALKGCVGQGDTQEEALSELTDNEIEWLESAKKYGIPIPKETVHREQEYSGKTMLRMSPITHEDASNYAKGLGVSLNQYINDAIVSYNERVSNMMLKTISTNSEKIFSSYITHGSINDSGRNNKVISCDFSPDRKEM